jgi:hypothetical protein
LVRDAHVGVALAVRGVGVQVQASLARPTEQGRKTVVFSQFTSFLDLLVRVWVVYDLLVIVCIYAQGVGSAHPQPDAALHNLQSASHLPRAPASL